MIFGSQYYSDVKVEENMGTVLEVETTGHEEPQVYTEPKIVVTTKKACILYYIFLCRCQTRTRWKPCSLLNLTGNLRNN